MGEESHMFVVVTQNITFSLPPLRDIFSSRCRSFNHAGYISDHVLSFFLSFILSDSLPKRIELVPNTKSLASR